jgi:uncharacterized protein (DUF779 family)
MTRFAIQRVSATAEALELIRLLREQHGDLAFIQPGECRDGSPLMCLTKAELLPGPSDVKLGEIGASPFYVDEHQYTRFGRPALVIDVAPGAAGGFALDGLEEAHFVTHTVDRPTAPVPPS